MTSSVPYIGYMQAMYILPPSLSLSVSFSSTLRCPTIMASEKKNVYTFLKFIYRSDAVVNDRAHDVVMEMGKTKNKCH